MNARLTFSKKERLSSKKEISDLFSKGVKLEKSGFILIYQLSNESSEASVKVAFGVPKKLFKKAVDRNLLKRRMREVYRHHKDGVLKMAEANNNCIKMMFLYRSSKLLDYREIEIKIVLLLNELLSRNEKSR